MLEQKLGRYLNEIKERKKDERVRLQVKILQRQLAERKRKMPMGKGTYGKTKGRPPAKKSGLTAKHEDDDDFSPMSHDLDEYHNDLAEEFADDQDIDFDDEYIQNIRMDMYQDLMKQFRATLK